MKRSHGTGQLYVKWGSCYGRWVALDGRRVNRKIGRARVCGEKGGITRAEAERGLRKLIEAYAVQPAAAPGERPPTVDEAAEVLRARLDIDGIRPSYRSNLESMHRVHVTPAFGHRPVDSVTRQVWLGAGSNPGPNFDGTALRIRRGIWLDGVVRRLRRATRGVDRALHPVQNRVVAG